MVKIGGAYGVGMMLKGIERGYSSGEVESD